MLLKRIYKHGKDGSVSKDNMGSPIIDHVKVLRFTSGKSQKFATKFMLKGFWSGLVSMDGDKITLNTKPALSFKIIRAPGYYCCHDNKPCGSGAEAREHIEANFKGVKSPDENNPAGYRKDDFYAAERVS